ncbi:hypothetical protein RHMOL_Rhmol06G0281500 [Rhododendron molle]|uniref:Uncharacterized protein n=1 Tax=Rhododendron molle TaxID=49168 RepID=A0ACC0NHE2_RHOML|nr:hypothetical protein RHMOL_Rhmol06G0281500 [Rhododendron molle]
MASKIVLALVFVFDLIAFALAVAAEQRRSTVIKLHQAHQDGHLVPPSPPRRRLALPDLSHLAAKLRQIFKSTERDAEILARLAAERLGAA